MNLNQLAVEVAKREGKKKQVDIAQIKEVIRHTIDIMEEHIAFNLFTPDASPEGSLTSEKIKLPPRKSKKATSNRRTKKKL